MNQTTMDAVRLLYDMEKAVETKVLFRDTIEDNKITGVFARVNEDSGFRRNVQIGFKINDVVYRSSIDAPRESFDKDAMIKEIREKITEQVSDMLLRPVLTAFTQPR